MKEIKILEVVVKSEKTEYNKHVIYVKSMKSIKELEDQI